MVDQTEITRPNANVLKKRTFLREIMLYLSAKNGGGFWPIPPALPKDWQLALLDEEDVNTDTDHNNPKTVFEQSLQNVENLVRGNRDND
ncbi:MAG TPA: hypothetical protein VLH19_05030 [Patescibacteria group bacterium]|nr:hypothetical protein [Patescibacteria group bacterium]